MATDSSSVLRLYHPGEAASLLNQDDPLSGPLPPPPEVTDNFIWEDLEDYRLDTTEPGQMRFIDQIHAINKVLKCAAKVFPPDSKKPDGTPADRSSFEAYDKAMQHYKLFEDDLFTWEAVEKEISDFVGFLKFTSSKLLHPLDILYVDHSFIQQLFPPTLINMYTSVVNRVYGTPLYDGALRIQTSLTENFLFHHLEPDTRFHLKIKAQDINLTDPIARIRIREQNRNDKFLKDKYFNDKFNVKKFFNMLLENYFPNVTWRYVGANQEMHRRTLAIILRLFELGLMEVEEMSEFTGILLQKLENLLVLETVCYRDFETTLVSYPKFILMMKAYFYECKELVVSICIHIVIMLNDAAFKDSYILFNKDKKNNKPSVVNFDGSNWSRAYFNNSEISNVLNRILTSYILQFRNAPDVSDRKILFSLINTFMMLVMDMKNDVFYKTSSLMTQPLINFYFSGPHPSLKEEAVKYKNLFVMLIDEFAHIKTQEEVTANRMSAALKKFLICLKQKNPKDLETFLFILAEECMPTVLMAMNTLIVGKELKKELQSLCMLAITEISKNNASCQAVLMNSDCMTHWLFLLSKSKILALNMLTKIFEFDCRLIYIDTDMFPTFMTQLKDLMWKHFSTTKASPAPTTPAAAEEKPPEPKNFDTWLKEFKDKVLTDNSESEGLFEDLLMVFLFLRMMNNFVRKRDTNYDERFFSLTIQKLIAPCFIDIFLVIIMNKDFLPRNEDEWKTAEEGAPQPVDKDAAQAAKETSEQAKTAEAKKDEPRPYLFTSQLSHETTYEDLINLIDKKKNGQLKETELRGLLFEVAMYTMVLMVETCSGLYHYWIHSHFASKVLPSFLSNTEYLMDLPEFGLKYRSVALQLYSCFAVFPNNGILMMRSEHLGATAGGNTEIRCILNHATGDITDNFVKELGQTNKVEAFLDQNKTPLAKEIARKYYLLGLFPMIYKYIKGMYLVYKRDDKSEKLLPKLKALIEAYKKTKPFLKTLGITPAESPFIKNTTNHSIVSKKNKILPISKGEGEEGMSSILNVFSMQQTNSGGVNYSKFDRPYDQTELISKRLGEIRDLFEDIMNELMYVYDHCSNPDDQAYFVNLEARYVRPSSITATKADPEPWNNMSIRKEDIRDSINGNKFTQNQTNQVFALAKVLVEKTGLSSKELRSFMELMDSYQNSKVIELSKPPSENNLMSFLNSSSSNNKNLIAFFGVLVQRMYADLFKEGDSYDRDSTVTIDPKKPENEKLYSLAKRIKFNCTKSSMQAKKNLDDTIVTFLEQDILNSIIRFLSTMMSGCEPIRRVLYESASMEITDPEKPLSEMTAEEKKKAKPFEQNWTYNFLSLLVFVYGGLASLTMNKTFQDYEYEIIKDREIELAKFLKNLCENNYMKFKEYLGIMVPRIAGLPIYNAGNSTALYYIYCRADFMLAQVKYHVNTFPVLVAEDTFETFSTIARVLMIAAEACTGPCPPNQDAIYKFRSDAIVGVLRRMIDDIDSSIYSAKTLIIEYLVALMDGGTEHIILHFGRNITFDELFDLIIDHCKRLFIFIKFMRDKSGFLELASEARKLRLKMEKEAHEKDEKFEQDRTRNDGTFDYYSYLRKVKTQATESNSDKTGKSEPEKTKDEAKVDGKSEKSSADLKDKMNKDLDEFYRNFGSRFVSKEILDYYKVEDYQEIMDLYIASSEFSEHCILQIALKLNDFMVRFSTKISGFNICLQNLYRSLIDHFGDEVPRHVHQQLGYYQRREVDTQPSEKLMIYMFITKIISQVEILNPSSMVAQNFQFQLVPKTFFLTAKTKNQFMRTADTGGMAIEMMQNFGRFETEMTDNLRFYQKYPWIYKLTSDDAFSKFKIILWLLGLALNILLIIFFRRIYYDTSIHTGGNIAIIVIAILICALSFFGSIGWFMSRYQQKVKLNRAQIEDEEKKSGRKDDLRFFKVYIWRSIIEESYMIIFMTHLFSNIFGLLFDPFFYTLQMLMIVFISTTANYVVKAITTHFKQLSLTMFLAILIMHSYSVLTAGHFWSYIDGNQPGQSGPLRCNELWECLLFTVNQGLRNGGGISDSTMSLDPNDSESKYISKFFYDLIFFMLINVISLNIIFGIIIDTFAAMREANDERDNALDTICMVCTVTKNSIEKRGENFREHVMEHHMFWKYLYFLTYLEGKNPEDYTGLENAIHEQFLKTQADWVPFEKESDEAEGEGEKKAIAAKPSADDKDSIKGIQDSTKAMSESIKTVEGKLKTLEENLAKMEKSIAENSNQNIDKISEKVSEKIKTMIDALKLKPAN